MSATRTPRPAARRIVDLLVALRALHTARLRHLPDSPALLAARVIRGHRMTPAAALVGDVVAAALATPDRRIVVSLPPREGKSTAVSVVGVLYALAADPSRSVILASYADSLAHEHSAHARALVAEHGEPLGLRVADDKSAAGRWRVDGHRGGLLAAGIGAAVTGFGADLLLLDDVTKNASQADSGAHRRRIESEFRSTLLSRAHPGASVVLIGTRWSEDDLTATLLDEGGWEYVNVPAVSEAGVPDALGRPPGVPMVSALGRTPAQFAQLRRSVGARAWAALYLGAPTPPEGGLIRREWLDEYRVSAAPVAQYLVVGVDPADSGTGDAAGIVAASVMADGTVHVLADRSAPMTAEQWASAAVSLAVEIGASEIAVESFAARETYRAVVLDARDRAAAGWPIRVTSWPPKGSSRGRGDAVARSAPLLQGLETGRCRIVGRLPEFETAATGWHSGQHQPDALAALTVAYDVLVHAVGGSSLASPVHARIDDGPSPYADRRAVGDHRRGVVDALAARAAAAREGDEATVTQLDEYLAQRGGWSRRVDGGGVPVQPQRGKYGRGW